MYLLPHCFNLVKSMREAPKCGGLGLAVRIWNSGYQDRKEALAVSEQLICVAPEGFNPKATL